VRETVVEISDQLAGKFNIKQAGLLVAGGLLAVQEIFNVGLCIRDTCDADDLPDLFKPGLIPSQITVDVPELMSGLLLLNGLLGLGVMRHRA
jgi:hypothetical protein